ncbi:oligopeptide transporter 2 [Diutina catenulata]
MSTPVVSHHDEKQPADADVDLDVVLSQQLSIGDVGQSLTVEQKKYIIRRLDYEGLESLDDLPPQCAYMIEKIEHFSVNEGLEVLRRSLVEFKADPNIMDEDYQLWKKLLDHQEDFDESGIKHQLGDALGDKKEVITEEVTSIDEQGAYEGSFYHIFNWAFQVRVEAGLIEFYSAYPQIRAIVDPYDDTEQSCETVRVYMIGIVWTVLGAVVDQIFSTRQPAISLSVPLVQVLIYPCGMFLAKVMPKKRFKVWRWWWDLNPGPWTRKEQMLATLCYSVTGGWVSYSNYNFHVQKLPRYYDDKWATFGYQVCLALAVNFMGFGLAGIVRKFAVYPVTSMWPTHLSAIGLNKGLLAEEKKENINGWRISRYRFFFIVFACAFAYQWLPSYLMPFLSHFNWMTWIAPTNIDLVNITGSVKGLGFNPLGTFDVSVFGVGSLYYPLAYTFNHVGGVILAGLCIMGVYYTNYKWTQYIPINTNSLFTNEGKPYQVRKVLGKNNEFDQKKYEEYGPPFYSAAQLLSYGAFFLIYPFVFFYEGMVHWRAIKQALKSLKKSLTWSALKNNGNAYNGFNDPFSRQMSKYPEVPEWCYTIILVVSLVLGIVAVEYYPTGVSCWVIFLSVALNFLFLIPVCAVYSRTGFSIGLNVLLELIVGYAVPGNPNAINIAKAFGYSLDGQAENYITNQKQAHYMRLPPRSLFRTQMVGVIIASFVQLGIIQFQMNGGIPNYCDPDNEQKFTCPGITTFFSASIQWGVIGPKKVFNGLYPVLPYCFLIGFLAAFPCIVIKKWLPSKYARYFQPTVWIGGFLVYAPNNLFYVLPTAYAGFAFMNIIFKRYNAWWSKYTYLLADGLNGGIALSSLLIFFCLQYNSVQLPWWGSEVSYKGYESGFHAKMNATLQAPDGYFGPRKGHYP